MINISAILIIPAEGDPHGLLKGGPCGSRPPMARAEVDGPTGTRVGRWVPYHGLLDLSMHPDSRALVLAWEGKPVAAGLFRLWYAADDIGGAELCSVLYHYDDDPRGLLVQVAQWGDLGTIVLLDADGREVADG